MDRLILERAQSAMLSRDYGLAARLYKTLLKAEPGNITILNSLGSLYVKSGEDEKAIPYYENILTFSQHDVDAMNSLGGIYRRLKRYDKGIEILNRALEENQKASMINYTLGFTYKDMGNFDDEIDCFESVVAENPSDVLAYNHLGSIYLTKKNYPKAVQSFRRGLQTDPNHPILHYNLGHAYEAEKNYAEAINCYELALKAKPGWIDAIRDDVKLLLLLQDTKRAMSIVQKSVQLYPSNAELIALLGTVQLKRYDFEEAQTTFEKADRLKPNDATIILRLAETFEKEYLLSEAATWAKEARVLGFSDVVQKKRYIHIMLSAGEFERACSVLEELIEESPSDVSVLDAKAQYCILTEDEKGRNAAFEMISELNPRYRHHYLDAARRYCQIKKYDEALEYSKKYIEAASLNPAGYNIQGRIYEKMGNLELAVKTYKIAANLKYEDIYAKKELKRLGHEWNENLQSDVSEYIAKLNEKEKEEEAKRIMAEEQAASELEEQMIEKEVETFDFEVMGDPGNPKDEEPEESVPLLAELSEDEGFSGFDSIDDNTDRLMEDEVESKEDDLSEIMAASQKKQEVPEETKTDISDEFIPGWDTPAPSRTSPRENTVPSDINDFMPQDNYSARDAMDMLREDQNPRMDPRLVNKIDDAVESLEKAVSDATEKAEKAIQKAEEAARKIEDAVPKRAAEEEIPDDSFMNSEESEPQPDSMIDPEIFENSPDEDFEEESLSEENDYSEPSISEPSEPEPSDSESSALKPSPENSFPAETEDQSLKPVETFDEPKFTASKELKDPFDNPVTPDIEPDAPYFSES